MDGNMSIVSAIFLLFLVMDPLGNVPLFLTALKDVDQTRRKRVIMREMFIALGILILFLVGGRYILGVLGITEPSLSIAGGIVLFIIALKMIFVGSMPGVEVEGEPFIVPLAIPLVAGPSTLTTLMLLARREPSRIWAWMLALICAWGISAVILVSSERLGRILGRRGLIALERLMGLILTMVAAQMFLTGLKQFMAS